MSTFASRRRDKAVMAALLLVIAAFVLLMTGCAHWQEYAMRDNVLVGQFSDNPADVAAFDYSTRLYPPGTTFGPPAGPLQPRESSNPPAGYYLGVCCTDAVRAACEALIAQGLPPGVIAQVGDRETIEPQWRAFIEAQGYVLP